MDNDETIYMFDSVEDIIDQGRELEAIEECEFEVVKNENGTFSLVDLLGAYLGDIGFIEFQSYGEILYRLEGSYLHDYGIVESK